MITKELLKSEIDKIQDDHLELFYNMIKALEISLRPGRIQQKNPALDWNEFVKSTYGCLADWKLAVEGHQPHKIEPLR